MAWAGPTQALGNPSKPSGPRRASAVVDAQALLPEPHSPPAPRPGFAGFPLGSARCWNQRFSRVSGQVSTLMKARSDAAAWTGAGDRGRPPQGRGRPLTGIAGGKVGRLGGMRVAGGVACPGRLTTLLQTRAGKPSTFRSSQGLEGKPVSP